MVNINTTRYRTTRDILIPKGNHVIFISHIRQDAYRLAQSLVTLNADTQWTWEMDFDSAIKAGLIEKIND